MKNLQHKNCSHTIHFLITILFWPWLLVWLACAASVSRHNRRVDASQRNEQLELLRRIADGQEAEQLIKQLKGRKE